MRASRSLGGAPQQSEQEPSRGYAKGRLTRTAVLETATRHFAQQGFEKATIAEIAAACGISRAGLLYHFPDKESLLAAVLEDRDRADRERFAPYTAIPDGIGVLRGMIDLAKHNEQIPGLIDLFARLSVEATCAEHPAHHYFTLRYARIRRGIARTLNRARRAGYLHDHVVTDQAAARLTALSDGIQVQWLFDRTIDMAAVLEGAIGDLLNTDGQIALQQATPTTNGARP